MTNATTETTTIFNQILHIMGKFIIIILILFITILVGKVTIVRVRCLNVLDNCYGIHIGSYPSNILNGRRR